MMKLLVLLSALMLAGCDLYYKSTVTAGGDFSESNNIEGDTDNSDNSTTTDDNSLIDVDGNTTGDDSTFTVE
jgi:hypothetical protein